MFQILSWRGQFYSVTVSKIIYWKEGRLNASLTCDRDRQQTIVKILTKNCQFQSRHGYGGGRGFPGLDPKMGLNKQLMRPLMTTLAPKTLGKYQGKYRRDECVAKKQCGSAAEKLLINNSVNKIAKKVKCERD